MREADRRMADAEALLEIASAQLSVAARNIANANAAEREYRRAVWHYTQLMKHRISNPLQTIIGMADTLRDMPDLERSRRQAMIEAIGQQARVLRDVSLEPRVLGDSERVLRPAPLEAAVRMHDQTRASQPVSHLRLAGQQPSSPVDTTPMQPTPPAPQPGATPTADAEASAATSVEPQATTAEADTPERPTPRRRSPFTRFRRNEADYRDDG